ncbi:ferrochelatase [Enterovibrio norvegicus]|uniref:ferrochelatase n=1 Tax=Enterovibrio norvegicus TaxID=188144 RepID=UPI000C8551B2|nr:ferrochelatase [Enterovibrio norvegicus]MCC4797928.1 ferrochelatase [Enterovibrio norvegicus]PMH72537.1 ferrochelatase [Enterovibrio norvegicus]PMI33067.1 ferrochelatase [Enterovibrio norvegicus]PMI34823.1 ferrochelatase [Enterovibrio norvegicus]PMN45030.1 ferrochelatase [Enterovibrio norvegicus]
MENKNKTGVLLANLGTPEAPTAKAVSAFLSEFLHDQRVVDMTRWLWCPLLHGIILPVRSPKVAKLYQSVWMEEGSPLMVYSQRQKAALETVIDMPVELGMTYGQPSILSAVESLQAQGCERILVLPLYPQYSRTTTAAVFDKLAKSMKGKPVIPEFRFINQYYDDKAYIDALAQSVESHWDANGKPDMLVCSYHGIPKRYADNGDPYREHCHDTTERLIARLNTDVMIKTTFQSRFGREEWLQPYTDKTLEQLPKDGVKRVDIISPAFSVDCLETLEEIAEQCHDSFMEAGGEAFRFIPCLNDAPAHIDMMRQLVERHTQGW